MQSFVFSIVTAVYNAERYIRETFDSVQKQTIGFDKIQMILVDDGSTDQSGRICDELYQRFPNNVLVIHKENGGQSSARNAGMERAMGKYINFLDADDRMTPDTLERVAAFFSTHEKETDVVSVPIRYFEAVEGDHWQNYLYQKGDRILSLKKEFGILQSSASNAFFVRESVKNIRFQEGLGYAEDTRYAMTCLAQKQTIGLVSGCCYEYRRRNTGDSSTQTIAENPLWKKQWMEQYELWALRYFQDRYGSIPRWVQYALLCHVGNRVNVDKKNEATEEDRDYTQRIRKVISVIEPEVIRMTYEVTMGNRLLLRSLMKSGKKPRFQWQNEAWNLMWGEENLGAFFSWPVRINRLKMQGKNVQIEGVLNLYPGMNAQDVQLEWKTEADQQIIPLEREVERDQNWNGYPICRAYSFICSVPPVQMKVWSISFCFSLKENEMNVPGKIDPGDQIPVLPIPCSTGWMNGWKYIVSAEGIRMMLCATWTARAKRELMWDVTLWKRKQFCAFRKRMGYHAMRLIGKTPAWALQLQDSIMDELTQEMKLNADLLF